MQWSTNNPWLTLVVIALMFISLAFCENIYFAGNISCTKRLEQFEDLHNEIDLIADCPSLCLAGFCRVRGSSPYAKSSSCCCAAIHYGSIKNEFGGRIHIRINHRKVPPLYKSTQNGVTSRGYSSSSSGTFTFVAIAQPERNNQTHNTQNVSSTTVAIVTSPSVITLETTSLPIMTSSKEENQKKTTGVTFQPTTTTLATKTEHIMSTRKEQEVTTSLTTSRSFNSDVKTTTQIIRTNVTATDQRHLTIRHSHFVVSLIAAFSAGIVSTVIALFVFYKLRRKKRRKRTENNSRSHTEETEVCVCYTNENEYQQGLLTDPDTCIRPCPNRQLLESDAVTVEQEPSMHNILMTSAPFEECSSGCSKRCHPGQFEF